MAMSRPAIPLVLALMMGLWLGNSLPPAWVPIIPYALIAALSLATAGFLLKPAITFYLGLLLFLLIGAGQTSYFSPRLNTPPVSDFLIGQSIQHLSGFIHREPVYSRERTRLIVRLTTHRQNEQERPVQGDILLTVNGLLPPLEIGDPIRWVARLQPIEGYHNPGGYDFQKVMARQGVRVSGFLDRPDLLISAGPPNLFQGWFSPGTLRSRVNAVIETSLAPPLNSLAQALLTGDQSRIPPEIRETFNRAGVSHLLAFSGLNLALIGGLAYYLIRFILSLSERALLYLNVRFWAYVGAFIPVAGYALLAGLSPSVARALLMVSLVFTALLLKRYSDLLNNLALAALILLLLSPESLFRPSFQLSFLSVWAIAYLLPKIWAPSGNPDRNPWVHRGIQYLWGSFCVSLVTQLATLPAVSWWFHQVSLIGLISNLILVPLTGILAVPIGLLALLSQPFLPRLAASLFQITGLLLEWTWELTRFFASLPGAWTSVSRPGWLEIAFYFLAVFILFNWRKIPGRAGSWA